MTQKDLAEEFLTKARENAMNFKDIITMQKTLLILLFRIESITT